MIAIKIFSDRPSALYRVGKKAHFSIGVYENEKNDH